MLNELHQKAKPRRQHINITLKKKTQYLVGNNVKIEIEKGKEEKKK